MDASQSARTDPSFPYRPSFGTMMISTHLPSRLTSSLLSNGVRLGVLFALLLGATAIIGQPVTAQSPVSEVKNNAGTTLFQINEDGFVGVNRSTPLTGNDAFGVQADVSSGTYGGMYLETTASDGRPFYGYATNGTATTWTYLDGSTNKWHLYNSGDHLTVQPDGNVGVGTKSPASLLTVNGMIESLSGGLTLPDGTVLNESSDLGVLTLPFSGSGNAPGGNFSATFEMTNTKDLGRAGMFVNNNSSNSGQALFAETQGTGEGARVSIDNASNSDQALVVIHRGSGELITAFTESSNTTNKRFTVQNDGDVLADGTFQGGGADVAEAFDVEGTPTAYEPGDVLTISTTTDRTVTKSTAARSTHVVGVYATKPGVLLSENGTETDLDTKVPMGVVGVIPTKVSAENGAIERGDLLVTAETPGHAMKAQPTVIQGTKIYPQGAILGKALQGFDGPGTGTIEVLVNVK